MLLYFQVLKWIDEMKHTNDTLMTSIAVQKFFIDLYFDLDLFEVLMRTDLYYNQGFQVGSEDDKFIRFSDRFTPGPLPEQINE